MSNDNQTAPPSFSVLINQHLAEIQAILKAVSFASSQEFPIDPRIERRLSNLVKALEKLEILKQEEWRLVGKPEGDSFEADRLTRALIRYNIVRDAQRLTELQCCSWHHIEYYPSLDCFELKLDSDVRIYLKAKHLPLPSLPFDKLRLVRLRNGFTWLSEETLKRIYQYLNR